MESFNNIAAWIALGLLFAIVVFFCIFYVSKLIGKKAGVSSVTVAERFLDAKIKLKNEIVHDIVADITPVLEKRLEKAF